jgi:hypothetical protein
MGLADPVSEWWVVGGEPLCSVVALSVEQGGGSRELPNAPPLARRLSSNCLRPSQSISAANSESWVILGSRLLDQPIDLPNCKAAPLPYFQATP